MIIKLECPSCKTEGSMSLADVKYKGPYKCWKCKDLFTIEIEADEVISVEPLSQEEFDKMMEAQKKEQEASMEEMQRQRELEELKNKFRK